MFPCCTDINYSIFQNIQISIAIPEYVQLNISKHLENKKQTLQNMFFCTTLSQIHWGQKECSAFT